MTTVGILGGGQLARMLALSGAPLGLRFLVMDTAADACAGQFAPLLVGDYRDETALAEFASKVDVATFDFENVPSESAEWLASRVPVFPNPRALAEQFVAEDHASAAAHSAGLKPTSNPPGCSTTSRPVLVKLPAPPHANL